MIKAVANRKHVSLLDWIIAAVLGLALSLTVWWGLVQGGGMNGGDTFPYFVPQKLVLADAFANGEIPLWHSLTGLGYPLLAESQAGVFYPPNQILYRITDVNTAYNSFLILHYWLAFVFAWRFCRCQAASNAASWFAASIFVYGWFPARVSLEWSIVGGVWLPLSLWLTDRLIEQPNRRRMAVLSLALGTQLLAGHFALAFITQLTILSYGALKLWFGEDGRSRTLPLTLLTSSAIALSLCVAAVQLAPTYELKRSSQRDGGQGKAFDPAYGHMPPAYATQVLASWWYWHSPEIRASRAMMRTPGVINAESNAVEAHLYWGMIPLALLLCLFNGRIRSRLDSVVVRVWLLLIVAAMIYATGWLIPVTRYLPGFGFFIGPGRYTIVCSLGGAILAALVLDSLTSRWRRSAVACLSIALMAVTIPDLLKSSEHIADAFVVTESPLSRIDKSWVRQFFNAGHSRDARLLASGPNVANVFGISCVPVYLGLGPAIYFEERLQRPTGPESKDMDYPTMEEADRLIELGVTHILTTEIIERPTEAITLIQQFPDAVLNAIWGRGSQPCYLYELAEASGRIVSQPASALTSHEFIAQSNTSVSFKVELQQNADVVLRELMFPGWSVFVDGEPAEPTSDTDPIMRATRVASGSHTVTWKYQPASFTIGAWISLLCVASLIAMIAWPKRKPEVAEV